MTIEPTSQQMSRKIKTPAKIVRNGGPSATPELPSAFVLVVASAFELSEEKINGILCFA